MPSIMSEEITHRVSFDFAPVRKRSHRKRRADKGQRVAMMFAFTCIILMGCVVMSRVATTYTPELRALRTKASPESFPLQMLYTGDQQLLIPPSSLTLSRVVWYGVGMLGDSTNIFHRDSSYSALYCLYM